MKKFKFILPALVFVLTFAISFASVSDMFVVKYAYLETPANVCRELASNPCDNIEQNMCTVISNEFGGPFQVYESDVPSQGSPAQCTNVVFNSSPIPIPVD